MSPPSSQHSPSLCWPSTPQSPSKPLPSLPTEEDHLIYPQQLSSQPGPPANAASVWADEKSLNRRADQLLPKPSENDGQQESESQSLAQKRTIPLRASTTDITPRSSSESHIPSHDNTASSSPPYAACPTSEPGHTSPQNPFRRLEESHSATIGGILYQEPYEPADLQESSLNLQDNNKDGPPILEYQPSTESWGRFASASMGPSSAVQRAFSNEEDSHAGHSFHEHPQLNEVKEVQGGGNGLHLPEKTYPEPDQVFAANPEELNTPMSLRQQDPSLLDSDVRPPSHPPAPQVRSDQSSKRIRASETYQIRLVNWFDASSPTNPRSSPIMVQNANGPCPLLALINALVLSTPSDLTTVLVETLRVREQVSLGLLLDAVIDELMSGRRGDAAQNLPDISELYAFLVTLHTGMNVNPRFVAYEETPINLMDAPLDMPTSLNDLRKPGGFEDTKEMKLYQTFAVPLMHGWIPPRNHPAFAALKRAARTYEDAQNIMFREEELETKLKSQGLSTEEQLMLEDIGSLKYFLSSTATQLTGYGLDTITESLAPGAIAILFRNDHFSTLYRHPKSGQLLTLVTDMGYAGHDEVVWESLVDVSGEGCEFYAGDFRPVGHIVGDTQGQNGHPGQVDEEGWETVSRKPHNQPPTDKSNSQTLSSDLPPLEYLQIKDSGPKVVAPNTEQEDHDLALAMQLQEEEEERSRRDAAARRREDELSQAYLNNADSSGRRTFPGFGRGATGASPPTVPPRGGRLSTAGRVGVGRTTSGSQQQTTRRQSTSEDAPPPSYEQAAKGPAYHPPANHPAHPHASPATRGNPTTATRPQPGRNRQNSSAYSEHAAAYGSSLSTSVTPRRGGHGRGRYPAGAGQLDGAPGIVRRRSDMVGTAAEEEDRAKEKECVVM